MSLNIICGFLNSKIQPFYYQIELIRDLIQVDPKINHQKVNTFGVQIEDFDNDMFQHNNSTLEAE